MVIRVGGGASMTALEKVEAFVKLWPHSPYGPAGSCIYEYKVKDVNLLYCMRMVAKELGHKPGNKELTATFVFLLSLSEIDEFTRWNECWPDEEPPAAELSRLPLFK